MRPGLHLSCAGHRPGARTSKSRHRDPQWAAGQTSDAGNFSALPYRPPPRGTTDRAVGFSKGEALLFPFDGTHEGNQRRPTFFRPKLQTPHDRAGAGPGPGLGYGAVKIAPWADAGSCEDRFRREPAPFEQSACANRNQRRSRSAAFRHAIGPKKSPAA